MHDIGHGLALRNQTDHFRFGEDRAHRRNGDVLFPAQTQLAHFPKADSQGIRHHLQEAPSARGALVVHDEVHHVALFIDPDDLVVLPTDIDDGSHLGIQVMGALRMAGDLSHGIVARIDIGPAVTRGHDSRDIAALDPTFLKRNAKALFGTFRSTAARGDDRRRHDSALTVHHHHVGAGRTAVDARHIAAAFVDVAHSCAFRVA